MPVWFTDLRLWGLLGAAVLAGLLWMQTERLKSCQQAAIADKAQVAVLSASLEAQNGAVARLEADGKARASEAAAALLAAQRQSSEARRQAELLQRALDVARQRVTKPGVPVATPAPVASVCPAADAAKEVRNALAAR